MLVGSGHHDRRTDDHIPACRVLNHTWDSAEALATLGTLTQSQIKEIAGDRWHLTLGGDVKVNINHAIMDYDHLLILGPAFPHEVVGFSGGAK